MNKYFIFIAIAVAVIVSSCSKENNGNNLSLNTMVGKIDNVDWSSDSIKTGFTGGDLFIDGYGDDGSRLSIVINDFEDNKTAGTYALSPILHSSFDPNLGEGYTLNSSCPVEVTLVSGSKINGELNCSAKQFSGSKTIPIEVSFSVLF